jgi:hypothetical protein
MTLTRQARHRCQGSDAFASILPPTSFVGGTGRPRRFRHTLVSPRFAVTAVRGCRHRVLQNPFTSSPDPFQRPARTARLVIESSRGTRTDVVMRRSSAPRSDDAYRGPRLQGYNDGHGSLSGLDQGTVRQDPTCSICPISRSLSVIATRLGRFDQFRSHVPCGPCGAVGRTLTMFGEGRLH